MKFMNSNEVSPAIKRLYLDLDGVVFPIAPASRNDPDIEVLHQREWWRKSVVQRLGSLGVELVIASNWGTAFVGRRHGIGSPLHDLKPTRALDEGALSRSKTKLDLIAKDIAVNPVDVAVWVDDRIGAKDGSRFSSLVGKSKVIKPNKFVGLLSDDVDAIEKFFTEATEIVKK